MKLGEVGDETSVCMVGDKFLCHPPHQGSRKSYNLGI